MTESASSSGERSHPGLSDAEPLQGNRLSPKVGVVVPTLNAGPQWPLWMDLVCAQTLKIHRKLVVDSSSTDGTPDLAKAYKFEVLSIPQSEFNHGGTRQRAALLLDDCDILVYLTQDALLAKMDALECLVAAFEDPTVALAYGRQLPHENARPFGAHARLFNYPPVSSKKTLADIPRLGIKTAFCSNSFSAYRRVDLMSTGGFASDLIFGEDSHVATRILLQGKTIAYVAEAEVHHSHDYSLIEDFRRCFDIGVLHARERWMLDALGKAEGEGLRFLRSEFAHLKANAPHLLPLAIVRAAMKYLGYHLGTHERRIPVRFKRSIGMFRAYWQDR